MHARSRYRANTYIRPPPFSPADWLDRLVLTQVQHTLGQSLTRDRTAGSSNSVDMNLNIGTVGGDNGEMGGAAVHSINQLYSALLQKAGAGKVTEAEAARADELSEAERASREAALESDLLYHMQDIAARTWQPKPLESDLDNFCCLVLELPMLSNTVIHDEKQAADVTPHIPPTTVDEMMNCAIIRTVDASDPYNGGKVVSLNVTNENGATISTAGGTGGGAGGTAVVGPYTAYTAEASSDSISNSTSQATFSNNNLTLEFSVTDGRFTGGSLAFVSDWDADHINLTEDQSRKLNFSTIRGEFVCTACCVYVLIYYPSHMYNQESLSGRLPNG